MERERGIERYGKRCKEIETEREAYRDRYSRDVCVLKRIERDKEEEGVNKHRLTVIRHDIDICWAFLQSASINNRLQEFSFVFNC